VAEIGHLGVGDVFGETALLTDKPRGAAIVAVAGLEVLSLSKKDFDELLKNDKAHVHFVTRRVGITAGQQQDSNKAMMQMMGVGLDIAVPPAHADRDKTDAVKNVLAKALDGSLLMKGMQKKQIDMVIDQMYKITTKKGSEIVTQGNPGYNLFVIESGTFTKQQKGGKGEMMGEGGMFGDLSLMYDAPQTATVTSDAVGTCWLIDRYSFRRILRNESEQALKLRVEFLDGVELLAPLTAAERMKIAEALELVSFPANHTVCEMGEVGDAMYIIGSGEVRFLKPEGMESTPVKGEISKARASAKLVEVGRAETGDYFGERSLLTGQPRAATAVTQTAVEFLKLDVQSFNMLFGPLEQILQERVESYQTPGSDEAKEASQQERAKPKLEDLTSLGTLGTGSFGYVRLMQEKKTGETYALKVVNKQHVVNTRQETHVIDEKVTMEAIRHPFCVNLICTYKDTNLLYWLMEPAMGGEMFGYLQAVTTLSERETKFYSSQVILAFAYMHSKNFIYRDLKPENILFDVDGYIKITDFGFAKQVTGLTYTLCGTPDYLAPEIIRGKGHGKGVDWWAVGVLIYEMLAGYSPFYAADQMKQFELITKGEFQMPVNFSLEVRDLINGLLVVNPYKRFGTIKGGADIIKHHKWFDDLDWNAIYNREVTAPMIPKVANKTDLSNYEDVDDIFTEMPYHGPEGEWDKYF